MGPTTLMLVQPRARSREWPLRRGTETCGALRIPTFRSGAVGETRGLRFRIVREGRFRAAYALVDDTSGLEIGHLRPDGRRRMLELGTIRGEWKRLGGRRRFGFVGEDGEPLVTARVRSGLLRSSGDVEISPGPNESDEMMAALLACYVLIRRNESAAAGAAASAVVATS